MRVTADRDVCVGAGMCVLTAPAVFDQDDEGIVTLLRDRPEDADVAAAREATQLCPSGAIQAHDD
jgi:ferredoxin